MSLFQNPLTQKTINDYEIVSQIGAGSFGFVYKATKKNTNGLFVIKQIPLCASNNINEISENDDGLNEARNEAKILSQLNHKYIVKYYDSFESNNSLFIVMEYCENGDLNSFLLKMQKKTPHINENSIWKFFLQMLIGLAYIHSKKILHRDLKAMNIFLSKNNECKIGDLGVAKILQNTMHAHTFIGTPFYLSPEILEGKPYNEKSDVWALGCILYELCTFKHPYTGGNQAALFIKIKHGKFEPIPKLYSKEMKGIINTMLDKNFFSRPTTRQILMMKVIWDKAKLLGMSEMINEVIGINSGNNSKKNSSSNLALNTNSNIKYKSSKSNLIIPSYANNQNRKTKGKLINLIKPPLSSHKPKQTSSNISNFNKINNMVKNKYIRNIKSQQNKKISSPSINNPKPNIRNSVSSNIISNKKRKTPSIDFSFISNNNNQCNSKRHKSINGINRSVYTRSNVSSDSNSVFAKAKTRSNSGNIKIKKSQTTAVIEEETNNKNNIKQSDQAELYKFIAELNQKTLDCKKENSEANDFVVEEDNSRICVKRNYITDYSISDIDVDNEVNKYNESDSDEEEEKVIVKNSEGNDDKEKIKMKEEEYKEKYDYYKKEVMKFSNENNCDALIEMIEQCTEGDEEKIEERTKQIKKYISNKLPHKEKEFIKLFENWIIYENKLRIIKTMIK